MPLYSRPQRLEPFILGSITALLLAACQAPPDSKPGAKTDAEKAAAKGPALQGDVEAVTGPKGPKVAGPNPGEPEAPADDGCCKYCFVGTPCGDTCLPEGKSCDKPEGEGCACSKDKRVAKTFRKGWQPPPNSGLLGPDVFNFNKAQGDPIDGPFTLAMAFDGDAALADAANGKLTAVFHTSMGDFECELFEEKAPLTVANFVGLVRGTRPYLDPKNRKSEEWVKGRYYDKTIFHRVIAGFMIQGGDPSASGRGTPGYFIPDEFDRSLRHTGPGILSMANRNPYDRMTQKPIYDEKTGLTVGNTGSAQFFVTVAKTEALDDRHTIFGRCDTKVPVAISQVRTQSRPIPDKPFEDVTIETIDIVRKK